MKKPMIIGAGMVLLAAAAGTALLSKHSANPSTVMVTNDTMEDTTVFVAFGADSVVLPTNWSFCKSTAKLNCSFVLQKKSTQPLTLDAGYLNATLSFGAPVGCGTTKAEMNVNNPKWYDVTDVSLVDGFSNVISMEISDSSGAHELGPPNGSTGNEKVFGLYPLGCDICTARQHPPCGIKPGPEGCKAGTQYKPDVPCQYQGPTMSGGSNIAVHYRGAP